MAGNIARAYVHEHIISNTIISKLWKLNMADCGREREEQTSRQTRHWLLTMAEHYK